MFLLCLSKDSNEDCLDWSFQRNHFFKMTVAAKLRSCLFPHADCVISAIAMNTQKRNFLLTLDISWKLAETLRFVQQVQANFCKFVVIYLPKHATITLLQSGCICWQSIILTLYSIPLIPKVGEALILIGFGSLGQCLLLAYLFNGNSYSLFDFPIIKNGLDL